MILKHSQDENNCKKTIRYYDKARDGMFDVLNTIKKERNISNILLPSYIGYSPKEGSGVYDPIARVKGMNFSFYRVDKFLNIDFESVEKSIASLGGSPFILLRIDYYGFTDKKAEELHHLVLKNNGYILEDNAHSIPSTQTLFGEKSDVCFYAMHKFLPMEKGGMVTVFNKELCKLKFKGEKFPNQGTNLWEYDFEEIKNIRRTNFLELEKMTLEYQQYFTNMRTLNGDVTTIPYSFPVIIKRVSRHELYNFLNQNGYGVTCLYYNIISQIDINTYPESKELSDTILNFSVHQDVDFNEYPNMLNKLKMFYDKE